MPPSSLLQENKHRRRRKRGKLLVMKINDLSRLGIEVNDRNSFGVETLYCDVTVTGANEGETTKDGAEEK
jgi:hypothetical protein